jgi:hypothetical protein
METLNIGYYTDETGVRDFYAACETLPNAPTRTDPRDDNTPARSTLYPESVLQEQFGITLGYRSGETGSVRKDRATEILNRERLLDRIADNH